MPVPDANAVVTTTFSSLPGEAFTTPPAKVMGTANAAIAGNPASSYWVTIWPLAITERPSQGCVIGKGSAPVQGDLSAGECWGGGAADGPRHLAPFGEHDVGGRGAAVLAEGHLRSQDGSGEDATGGEGVGVEQVAFVVEHVEAHGQGGRGAG